MPLLPPAVDRLAERFARFPGIGPKTAQRLAFYSVRMGEPEARALASAVTAVADGVGQCQRCHFMAEVGRLCEVCRQAGRDQQLLCVVEDASDVMAIERSAEYRGLYYVLGGALSPLDGVGPNDLQIDQLEDRIRTEGVGEVILATDSDVEGEATSSYLHRRLEPLGVKVSRLAHGLPVGGELAYADERTVARAFAGRLRL